jgi:hypothetical protein
VWADFERVILAPASLLLSQEHGECRGFSRDEMSAAKKVVNYDKRKTLTFNEIEELYGFSPVTLRKWTQRTLSTDGKPPLETFKPGKETVVFRDHFEDYIRRFPG